MYGEPAPPCPNPPSHSQQPAPHLSESQQFPQSQYRDLSRTELINLLEAEKAFNKTLESKLHRQGPLLAVQETVQNHNERDESLEEGRAPPLQAEMVRPDVRLYVTDRTWQRVERQSDIHDADRVERGDPVMNMTASPTGEWSGHRVVSPDTMPAEMKCEVLIQALQQYQKGLEGEKREKKQAEDLNHSLLTQLNFLRTERQDNTEKMARMEHENAAKDEQIRDLTQQLRQARYEQSSRASLRPGTKRGRFLMSKTWMLECANCKDMFTSEEAANNSACCHHPKPASQLPNKMVGEVFPEERSKLRYWACCKQIGTKVPPPCHHGTHSLRCV